MVRVPANLSNYDASVYMSFVRKQYEKHSQQSIYIIHFILNRKKNHHKSIKFIYFVKKKREESREKKNRQKEREKMSIKCGFTTCIRALHTHVEKCIQF